MKIRTLKPDAPYVVKGHNPITGVQFPSKAFKTLKGARIAAKIVLGEHSLGYGYPTHVSIVKIVEFVFPK